MQTPKLPNRYLAFACHTRNRNQRSGKETDDWRTFGDQLDSRLSGLSLAVNLA